MLNINRSKVIKNYNRNFFGLLFLLTFSISVHSQNIPIYSYRIDSVRKATEIYFSKFRGKKILIVNAALLDSNYFQWRELNQLQKRNSNKLIIIILPSNDYSDESAASFFEKNNYSFVVASKGSIHSTAIAQLKDWLGKKSLNGFSDSFLGTPFRKYLINEEGKLIGIFEPAVSPMSKAIIYAIEQPSTK